MSQRVALKIDVDTLRGTREGVPQLLRLLARQRVDATFLFSLGPDHTGRALKRIFRPGFFSKVVRTSVTRHYGWKTLCYGTLLPGPDIGRREQATMRAVRDAGFEVGVHCFDHVLWQDHVRGRDPAWTRRQMTLAVEAFDRVFHDKPPVHGAAGWQLNEFVPAIEAELGFHYASDTRGREPFLPVMGFARGSCPQLPTTLPTFDEIIGVDGCTEENVAHVLFRHSLAPAPAGHVFTLHAELEGMRLLSAFDTLLQRWLDHGLQPCSLREIYRHLPSLPAAHEIHFEPIKGRSGELACQGRNVDALDQSEPRLGLDDQLHVLDGGVAVQRKGQIDMDDIAEPGARTGKP
nr:polysaccharide deacetylase family protein [uncultured Steroidobacter sp.]